MAKIVQVVASFDYGGATSHVLELLSKFRHSSDLYLLTSKPPKNVVLPSGVSHYEIEKSKLTLRNVFRILKFSKDASVLHAHGRGAFLNCVVTACVRSKCRFIYTVHGVHLGSFLTRHSLTAIYKFALSRWLVIFVSNDEKAEFCKVFGFLPPHYQVIHNGIPDDSTERLRGVDPNFVSYMRFHYQKNPERLIEFAANNPDLKIDICGDGELFSECEELIQKLAISNVFLHGYQSSKSGFLGARSVYISTSRWEGMPIAVIEALRDGLPCILSDVPGHREIHRLSQGNVLLIKDFSSREVRMQVSGFIENYAEHSAASRVQYLEFFEATKMLEKYAVVYRV